MANKKTILVFDKFLGYNVGGAQRSLHTLVKALPHDDYDVHYVGCEVGTVFGAHHNQATGISVSVHLPTIKLPRLPYIEYWLNRKSLKQFFASRTEDILITQGLWGAIAARFFPRKTIIFVRDVYQLNVIPMYRRQWYKNIAKAAYLALQWGGLRLLRKDTKKALARSLIIANSQFMANEVRKRFNQTAMVIFPPVNEDFLHRAGQFEAHNKGFVTLVGDEKMKGRRIVELLARKMPHKQFLIVGRAVEHEETRENVTYRPWGKHTRFFEETKIILMPSIWPEGFGRVALEAMLLGIPAVGTDRGGLTEILPPELRISNPWNLGSWKSAINLIERDYSGWSERVKQVAQPFVAEKPVDQFLQLVASL